MKRKNDKRDVISAQESDKLCASLNASGSAVSTDGSLIDYVQYFGSISNAASGRFIAVDSAGFDLQYTITGEDDSKFDLRVQFDRHVPSIEAAASKLVAMGKEAKKVLGVPVDKSYVPPGKRGPINFHFPKPWIIGSVFGLWTLGLGIVFLDNSVLPVEAIYFREYFTLEGLRRALLALVIIHTIEAFVALGLCIYGKLPAWATIAWMLTILVFGVPSLQNCLKVVIAHSIPRNPEFFGVPRTALDPTLNLGVGGGVVKTLDDEGESTKSSNAAVPEKEPLLSKDKKKK